MKQEELSHELGMEQLLLLLEITMSIVDPLSLSFVLKSLLEVVFSLNYNKQFCLECLSLLYVCHWLLLLRVDLILRILNIRIPVRQIWVVSEVLIESTILEVPLSIEEGNLFLLLIRLIVFVRFSNWVFCIFNNMENPLLVLKELIGDLGLGLSELSHHCPELSQLLRIIT